MSGMPVKHKRFCEQYHMTGNATRSYLNVYKCTLKSANVGGCKLLKNPKVQAYLKRLGEKSEIKTVEKFVANANDILHEDSLLALHRVPGAFDENGMLKDIADWPEALQASIKSIEYEDVVRSTGDLDKDGKAVVETIRVIKKIHFHDKGAALGRMEKALGLVQPEGGSVENNQYNIKFILQKIDGLNRGKLPQDCE